MLAAPVRGIMLDMDFNVSPTYGENEQPTRGCDRSYQSDLDQIPAPAPKDKQMAGARLTPERLLAGSNKEQLSLQCIPRLGGATDPQAWFTSWTICEMPVDAIL